MVNILYPLDASVKLPIPRCDNQTYLQTLPISPGGEGRDQIWPRLRTTTCSASASAFACVLGVYVSDCVRVPCVQTWGIRVCLHELCLGGVSFVPSDYLWA